MDGLHPRNACQLVRKYSECQSPSSEVRIVSVCACWQYSCAGLQHPRGRFDSRRVEEAGRRCQVTASQRLVGCSLVYLNLQHCRRRWPASMDELASPLGVSEGLMRFQFVGLPKSSLKRFSQRSSDEAESPAAGLQNFLAKKLHGHFLLSWTSSSSAGL